VWLVISKDCCVCGDTYKVMKFGKDGDYKDHFLCNKHFYQVNRNGEVSDSFPSRRRDRRVCDICEDDYKVKQVKTYEGFLGMLLCSKHYTQVRDNGKIIDKNKSHLREERVCRVCNTEDNVIYYQKEAIFLCRKHYDQKYLYGKILKRTVFDKNEIFIKEDYAEVVLYNRNHEEVARSLIDLGDVDLIREHKWYLGSQGYPSTRIYSKNGEGRNFGMHKIITNTTKEIIDHKNRNRLDNRRFNLIISNKSKNAVNSNLRANNSSGVTGVSFSKRQNKWRSYISSNGKRLELGWFKDLEIAVKERLFAEIKYYPDNPPQKHLFLEYGIEGYDG
jgi:hypothetical protein